MLKRVQHDEVFGLLSFRFFSVSHSDSIAVILNLFQDLVPPAERQGTTCMERCPAVYIVTNRKHGTLYIGVTSDPIARLWQHRTGTLAGFTKRYGCERLVLIEFFGDMEHAILREKQLKRWHRDWKINLIEASNPDWRDLAVDYGFEPLAARSGRVVDAETSSA